MELGTQAHHLNFMRYGNCTRRALFCVVVNCLAACASAEEYRVELAARLQPKAGTAALSLTIKQDTHELRKLDFKAPDSLFDNFSTSAGRLEKESDRVVWHVPDTGGILRYTAELNVPKGDAYDARITENWALLRFEDILPPLRSTARSGSTSNFTVRFNGPKDWSFETRYGRWKDRPLHIESANKGFDRPTGWLIAGQLGVRRETIEGRNITIAAPAGSHFPRIPTLAFLQWTLPDFVDAFPSLPDQILLVSGDESMWRGALSGPDSLFIHAKRPLISENGTSTLLHELVHVSTRLSAVDGSDWIVEGLAEYYSIEILRRSKGLSQKRFDATLDGLREWVKKDNGKLSDPSTGVDTAAAVLLFAKLDEELRESAPAGKGLDAAVQHLLASRNGRSKISKRDLKNSVDKILGHKSLVLQHIDNE